MNEWAEGRFDMNVWAEGRFDVNEWAEGRFDINEWAEGRFDRKGNLNGPKASVLELQSLDLNFV